MQQYETAKLIISIVDTVKIFSKICHHIPFLTEIEQH
jgi:hypothetical protein